MPTRLLRLPARAQLDLLAKHIKGEHAEGRSVLVITASHPPPAMVRQLGRLGANLARVFAPAAVGPRPEVELPPAPLTRRRSLPSPSLIRVRPTAVSVAHATGRHRARAVSCDNITAVPVRPLGRQLRFLLTAPETALTEAIRAAFDLH